jgi:hypothetical protein
LGRIAGSPLIFNEQRIQSNLTEVVDPAGDTQGEERRGPQVGLSLQPLPHVSPIPKNVSGVASPFLEGYSGTMKKTVIVLTIGIVIGVIPGQVICSLYQVVFFQSALGG